MVTVQIGIANEDEDFEISFIRIVTSFVSFESPPSDSKVRGIKLSLRQKPQSNLQARLDRAA